MNRNYWTAFVQLEPSEEFSPKDLIKLASHCSFVLHDHNNTKRTVTIKDDDEECCFTHIGNHDHKMSITLHFHEILGMKNFTVQHKLCFDG